jgi:hypothetical protein
VTYAETMTNIEDRAESVDLEMNGLRVLVIFPPSKKDRTQYLMALLETAKKRWSWQINGIAANIDFKAFEKLVAPEGRLFSPPWLLRVADWEKDAFACAETDRNLQEAENKSSLPLGRAILSGAHGIGRAYNVTVRHTNQYPLIKKVLRDNSEPGRIFRRLFRFADNTIEACQVDLVIAFDWATPLHFSHWMAATRRGIPCVALRNSKIVHDQAFWTLDRLLFNTVAVEEAANRITEKEPVTNEALERVRAFRNQPATIKYIANRWRYRVQRNFLRWHWQFGGIVTREIINTLRGQDNALRERWVGRFLRFYRRTIYSYYHQLFINAIDEEELAKTKYVYFPMHKEAELAQSFQATLWNDQRNTIRILATNLPFGYRLLVREHRMNFGFRPTRFYRAMSKLPNVVMLDPFDSQFKYLRHADLVVTENGSSGWEGLLLGRRVLLLSDTFFDGARLGTKVTDPDNIGAAIVEILSKPAVADQEAHDRQLAAMVDAEKRHTFPMMAEAAPAALNHLANTTMPALRTRTEIATTVA